MTDRTSLSARKDHYSLDNMTKFFKAHPDALLVLLAALIMSFLIAYYIWGIQYVVDNVNRGLKFTPQMAKVGFDLDGASKLDLRGLTGQ